MSQLPVALPAPQRFGLALRVARKVNAARGMTTALAAFRMVWSSGGMGRGISGFGGYGNANRYGMIGTLPGSQTDFVKVVGDPTLNAAVAICVNWVKRQLPEPRFVVKRRKRDGTEIEVPNHPLTQLLKKPNKFYDGAALLAESCASYLTGGNGYNLRARGAGGAGKTLELWFVPYWEIHPRWALDGSTFIDDYLYRPGGKGIGYPIDTRWVVHYRSGLNPYNQGRTASPPLFPLLPAIAADSQGDLHWYSLMDNMGIVGAYISPLTKEDSIPPEQREMLEELWVEKFTGDNRGKPLVSELPIKIEKLGLSPAELDLGASRDNPEKRITAIFGLTRTLVGLGEATGFDNGGQQDAARRGAYEDCIIPMLTRFCLTWDDELLPEYRTSPSEFCAFDYSQVRCLQDDQDKLFARWANVYAKGLATRDEGRQPLGMKPVAELPQYKNQPPGGGSVAPGGAPAAGGSPEPGAATGENPNPEDQGPGQVAS